MFIFSQFNFPDPKPWVSEGDCRVPGGRLGVGAAVTQKQKETKRELPRGDEGEEPDRKDHWTLSGGLGSAFTTSPVLCDPKPVPAFSRGLSFLI